jgi:hypothetical protein
MNNMIKDFFKCAFAFFALTFSFCFLMAEEGEEKEKTSEWKEDFEKTVKKGKILVPEDWENRQTKWTVPPAKFNVEKKEERNVLKVTADKASGMFLYNLSGIVDLKKTPVLRWRWKAVRLPKGADGRGAVKDDQAVAI